MKCDCCGKPGVSRKVGTCGECMDRILREIKNLESIIGAGAVEPEVTEEAWRNRKLVYKYRRGRGKADLD